MMFPDSEVLKKLLLFVNNGKNGNFEVYLIAAFHKERWAEVSDTINNIPSITQTYIISPEGLLSLAIQGHYYIAASSVTPKSIDWLYAKGKN